MIPQKMTYILFLALSICLVGCIEVQENSSEEHSDGNHNMAMFCKTDLAIFNNALWEKLQKQIAFNVITDYSMMFSSARLGLLYIDMTKEKRDDYYRLASSFLVNQIDEMPIQEKNIIPPLLKGVVQIHYRSLLELHNPSRVYCDDRGVILLFPTFAVSSRHHVPFLLACIRSDGKVLLHKKTVPPNYIFNGEADISSQSLKVKFLGINHETQYKDFFIDDLLNPDANKNVVIVNVGKDVFSNKLWERLSAYEPQKLQLDEREKLVLLSRRSPSVQMDGKQRKEFIGIIKPLTQKIKANYGEPSKYFDSTDANTVFVPSIDEILLAELRAVNKTSERLLLIFKEFNIFVKQKSLFWVVSISESGNVEVDLMAIPAGYACTEIANVKRSEFTVTLQSLEDTIQMRYSLWE